MKAALYLKTLVKARYERLRQIRDAPRAVAGGVAIGIFWGFTPLLGFKTLLSIFFAWISRSSKISAAISVSFLDVLTPIWPIFLRWEYDLGFLILNHPHHFPKGLSVEDVRLKYWFHLKMLEILWPMFVGSLLFAVPFASSSYWFVKQSLSRYEHIRQRRRTPLASKPEIR